ncbi:MAG: hypothetical protein ACP5N3_04050 [Candidatus Nanoarchaeia archaeon]
MKKQQINLENVLRDAETKYIICPESTCDYFEKNPTLCESDCPEKESYKIIHCRYGHPNKLEMKESDWRRLSCSEGCYANILGARITKSVRIPLDAVSIFLETEFKKE